MLVLIMSSPQFDPIATALEDVFVIQRTVFTDQRGVFGKVFNKQVFSDLSFPVVEWKECIYSKSDKNVIRGMHYQSTPFGTAKLISVVQGSIIDVIVGIGTQNNARNYGQTFSVELSASNCKSLFIPDGYAHGFKSLEDNTIVVYLQSQLYSREHDTGFHFDSFGFDWNIVNPIVSIKDQNLPSFPSLA